MRRPFAVAFRLLLAWLLVWPALAQTPNLNILRMAGSGGGLVYQCVYTQGSLCGGESFARASNGWAFDSTGTLTQYSSNVARFDYDPSTLAAKGLLLEGARTNSIRNSTATGAVAGSPGTLGTNWATFTAVSGLTRTVSNPGSENGIPYGEIRIAGTPGSSGQYNIYFDTATGISASTGQIYALSAYARVSAGSLANITLVSFAQDENTAAGAYVTGGGSVGATFTPTSAALGTQRFVRTNTLSGGGTVGATQVSLRFNVTAGQAIDVTFRIAPQVELLSSASQTASSPILTTGTALTRSADIATLTGAAAAVLAAGAGTALVETTQYVNSSGLYGRLIGATTNAPLELSGINGRPETYNGTTSLTLGSTPTWSTGARGAVAWSSSGRSVAGTGGTVVSDAGAFNVAGPFFLGGSTPADGWYSRVAFYNRRLSDAELAAKVVLGSPLVSNDNVPDWLRHEYAANDNLPAVSRRRYAMGY